tara:strand:- start:1386 stop:2729 length:1344 start_codon:yes stop_codon:yes gene_type:complete
MKMTGLKRKKTNGELPEEALERLRWWAELHGKTEEEAIEGFSEYCAESFGMMDFSEEDDGFIVEASETFVVERRVSSGGGSAGESEEFVGMFVGIESKVRDRRERDRAAALRIVREQGLTDALESGRVARAFVEGGVWMLEKANGIVASTQERYEEGVAPWFLVEDGGMQLALLQNNPEWGRHGEPIAPYMWARTFRFEGNSADKLDDEIRSLRITVSASDLNECSKPVRMFESCKIRVRVRKNVNPGWEDTYSGVNRFFDNITYTDDFVPEDERALLQGENFVKALGSWVDDLTDLTDLYEDKSEKIAGIDNPVGPLVAIKARVMHMNKEGYDSEFDPTGKDYIMRVSSFALQRAYPTNMMMQELSVRIHGHLAQENHAFDYHSEDGWKPYAVKSTVIIFGRLGVRRTDDGDVPKINAMGVYAVPRLAIPAGEGGNTNLSQFSGDE